MTLREHILKALAGASSQKPVRGDALLQRLGVGPDTLNDALEDLRARNAINRSEITKGGETYTVVWPTGVAPAAIPWRGQSINGHTQADARAAHQAAHQAINRQESSPTRGVQGESEPVAPSTHVTAPQAMPPVEEWRPPQEPPMPRIARPANPHNKGRKINYPARRAPFTDAVLETLKTMGGAPTSDEVHDQLPAGMGTPGSTDAALRKLRQRGQCQGRRETIRSRNRWVFWTGEAEPPRREAGRSAGAGKAMPVPHPAAAPVAAAGNSVGQGDRPHFAVWDDGELHIDCGGEMVRLDAADVSRLYRMLHGQKLALEALA